MASRFSSSRCSSDDSSVSASSAFSLEVGAEDIYLAVSVTHTRLKRIGLYRLTNANAYFIEHTLYDLITFFFIVLTTEYFIEYIAH